MLRNYGCQKLLSGMQNIQSLFSGNPREVLQELIQALRLQPLEQRLHRYPRSGKDRSAAHDFGSTLMALILMIDKGSEGPCFYLPTNLIFPLT